ncbi:MAG: hypothetical protein GY737_25830 [Desulfobacteraceae bacterium]|nr:hypothetical protein [Desulfobacteraceae bacterium]
MNQISTSSVPYLVFAYAIIIGILIGFYFILLSKIEEYVGLKKTKNIWFKIREGLFRVILAIASIYIVLILPIELLRHFIINPDYVKELYDLYFYSVVCSSIVSTLFLIKLGKIRIKRKP